MDHGVCRERHDLRRQRRWGSEDVDEGWAAHNRIASGEEFDRWFLYRQQLRGGRDRPRADPGSDGGDCFEPRIEQ